MIRFAWSAMDVEDKIAGLRKGRDRKKARRAWRFLTAGINNSAYASFIDEHREFQEKHRKADEKQRLRPLSFIETKCGWLTDTRRESARRKGLSGSESDSDKSVPSLSSRSDSDEDEDAEGENFKMKKGRHSIRRSFIQKVLGPIVGYSESYELLHFVYDLVIWSTLGGTKNSAKGIPLRLAMKGCTISPEYWRVRHLALIDLLRQIGLPALFRSKALFHKADHDKN
eukprot:6027285-Amphidinium_carterae.5